MYGFARKLPENYHQADQIYTAMQIYEKRGPNKYAPLNVIGLTRKVEREILEIINPDCLYRAQVKLFCSIYGTSVSALTNIVTRIPMCAAMPSR